jgi:predicted peptidase
MKNILVLFLIIGLEVSAAQGSTPVTEPHKFSKQITRDASIDYLLSLPSGYKESKQKWPLIFFLHGGSGRGDDLNLVTKYGPPAIAAKGGDYPFIVLSPQCKKGEIWTDTDMLISLLDDVIIHYRVDPERIYLTGASMGGRGVLSLAYKHPERFAAIVPVCPWAPNTDWAPVLKNVPVWIFHGDKDPLAPIKDSIDLVKALRSIGNDVQFTILPGRGHDITDVWDRADLYTWLLKHRIIQQSPVK